MTDLRVQPGVGVGGSEGEDGRSGGGVLGHRDARRRRELGRVVVDVTNPDRHLWRDAARDVTINRRVAMSLFCLSHTTRKANLMSLPPLNNTANCLSVCVSSTAPQCFENSCALKCLNTSFARQLIKTSQ